jgi:hypothetical protein
MRSTILPIFIACVILCSAAEAAKFSVTGPILTVTLKEPEPSAGDLAESSKWLNLGSLRPNVLWSISSNDPPLPNWLPALKSCRTTVGYRYDDQKTLPSYIEADATFANDVGELQVQPTYEVGSKKTSIVVQASNGNSFVVARLATRGKRVLEFIRGSYSSSLPFASISGVRVTSSFDFIRSSPTLTVEGVTGSARTKAILNLQYQEPTLTVVHALDERNTIAPEISLHTAKILYQWNMMLDSGALRTKVDPTSAIQVTWTDRSMNGKWVTDFSLPLKGTSVSALAADVRVRRQFTF